MPPSHHEVLLGLSSNPLFVDVRQQFISNLNESELDAVIKGWFSENLHKAQLSQVALLMLDLEVERVAMVGEGRTGEVSVNREPRLKAEVIDLSLEEEAENSSLMPEIEHNDVDLSLEELAEESSAVKERAGNLRKRRRHDTETPCSPSAPPPQPSDTLGSDIEQVVCVPDEQGGATWTSLHDLPEQLVESLKSRIDADWMLSQSHQDRSREVLRDPARYILEGRCFSKMVRKGNSGPRATWVKSNGNRHRACDACIRANRICTKLETLDGVIKLAICPLPSHLRIYMTPHDVGFWTKIV